MAKNGYTMVELLVVIVVVGIGFFILANRASYAFSTDYDEEEYKQTISYIESTTAAYVKTHEDNTLPEYTTVKDLADLNIIVTDGNGNVVDPRDKNHLLNDLQVRIIKKGNEVTAKVQTKD